VNFPWLIRIAPENAAALARLRLVSGIEVGESADALWLRGKPGDDSLARDLSLLPAEARYEELPNRQLRLVTNHIPSGSLPSVRWQPIGAWARIETPPAAMPAFNVQSVPLRLVRSAAERDPEVLLTTLTDWAEFAGKAGRVRLQRLSFAASPDGKALVRGTPLPPIPGQRFVLHGGLAVPAGFTWQPAVSAGVVVHLFNVAPDALVLWLPDGTIMRLHTEQFVPATWSAVRATLEALASPS
jgi:hypothetical protein